jgi:putative tricarboxylic transport membrane protein
VSIRGEAVLRRMYQGTAVVFLALGAYVIADARQMEYFTPIGPGAGFFPFWLGVLMVGLAAVWLGQVSFGSRPVVPPDFVPDRAGATRILVILGALVLLTAALDRLGYCLAMLAFALGLLVGVGRQSLAVSLPIALAGSFGVYYVFRYWLGVHLPPSALPILRELGF